MLRLRTPLIASLLAVAAASQAVLFETEPNNTFATANAFTGTSAYYTDQAIANLTLGDVDWFSIQLKAGDFLSAATTPLDPTFLAPDTYMALFDTTGASILVSNDDGGEDPTGTTYGSAIRYQALTAGTYFLAVAGYNDTYNDDDVESYQAPVDSVEVGRYSLLVGTTPQAVPEPASMVALGVGALALVRRRRNRA